eukprot:scaffold280563_cov32-Tisochrysis_lutea.AAC.2
MDVRGTGRTVRERSPGAAGERSSSTTELFVQSRVSATSAGALMTAHPTMASIVARKREEARTRASTRGRHGDRQKQRKRGRARAKGSPTPRH